jgi:hypothetical protein
MALFFGPQYTGAQHNDMMVGTENYDLMEAEGKLKRLHHNSLVGRLNSGI